jgi:glycosyltransferase involved in cell wall biosynthesis
MTVSLGDRESVVGPEDEGVSHVQALGPMRSVPAVWRAVQRFRPDVAHVSAVLIPIHAVWIRLLVHARIPFVISPHGLLSPAGMNTRFAAKVPSRNRTWLKKAYFRHLDLPLLHRAAGLHAQADYERELLIDLGLGNVFVVPLGVDGEWVDLALPDRAGPRMPTTFSYLGRVDTYHKGLDLVLTGFEELKRRGLDQHVRLIIAGSDVASSFERIARQVRAAGLTNVELRGQTWGSEKERLWADTDYFLSVFRYAGMARATAEALGHGVPVIATRESNWGDWVQRHDMGFCVNPDERAVTDLLYSLATEEPSRYARRSRNASSFASRNSWDLTAQEMSIAYERLLKGS